jgi:hypothetical protein
MPDISSDYPTVPPVEYPKDSKAPEAALPQFDAYLLPPGRGMAAIPTDKQDAVTQNILMKDTAKDSTTPTYSDYKADDAKRVKSFLVGNVKQDDVDQYLASVNRDIRLKIANDQWDKYLDDKKPDDIKPQLAQYHKLQETEAELKKNDGAEGVLSNKLRQQLITASGGKLKAEDLKEFEERRLAEAERAEKVLTMHRKSTGTTTEGDERGGQRTHRHHHQVQTDDEGGEAELRSRHMRGRGTRAEGTEQGGGSDDETTKLNKAELARVTRGDNAATSGRGQEATTEQQWMQNYSAWYYSQYGNRGLQQQQQYSYANYANHANYYSQPGYNPSYASYYNQPGYNQSYASYYNQPGYNPSQYYGANYSNMYGGYTQTAYNPYQYSYGYGGASAYGYGMQPGISPLGNIALSLGFGRPPYNPWMYRPPIMPMFAFGGGWRRPGFSIIL